jgi:hypothetical protein
LINGVRASRYAGVSRRLSATVGERSVHDPMLSMITRCSIQAHSAPSWLDPIDRFRNRPVAPYYGWTTSVTACEPDSHRWSGRWLRRAMCTSPTTLSRLSLPLHSEQVGSIIHVSCLTKDGWRAREEAKACNVPLRCLSLMCAVFMSEQGALSETSDDPPRDIHTRHTKRRMRTARRRRRRTAGGPGRAWVPRRGSRGTRVTDRVT